MIYHIFSDIFFSRKKYIVLHLNRHCSGFKSWRIKINGIDSEIYHFIQFKEINRWKAYKRGGGYRALMFYFTDSMCFILHGHCTLEHIQITPCYLIKQINIIS